MPTRRPDRVRLITFIYRKKGMSHEEFYAYWRDEHTQIFPTIPIVKKNLLDYEQGHVNQKAVQLLKDSGYPIADCDGIAIFEGPSYEKIIECFKDEEYQKAVEPDEDKFMDRTRTTAIPMDIVSIFSDPT